MNRFRYAMRALLGAILLICVFVCSYPKHADALDCATPGWWNFDRIDGDPQKRRQDAEARAALANLGPIVFRGRVAWVRSLSDLRKNNSPVLLVVFKDVEVLRGVLRSVRDRKAFLLYYAWCDGRCRSVSRGWSRGLNTYGAYPFSGEPVRDIGTMSKKVIYKGRVDATVGACNSVRLTPLQERLLNAPDEIDRLMRENPYHPVRGGQPAGSE